MKLHFIAIGGSAMHNLALALHKKGYHVSGSDDEIFEPSKSRLEKYGLLPAETGWFPDKVTGLLDAVILGMHAKADNPELLMAKELGVKIFSYPEFLFEQAKDKKRIVIAGSHGKTTITAMIMHVLQHAGIDFDFMVGAQLDGFDVMVKISEDADLMILEGDEYLTSPIDLRPKFHLYKPHIALITGIAWDHINVFPTFDIYVDQFRQFIQMIEDDGLLTWYQNDEELQGISGSNSGIRTLPYNKPDYQKKGRNINLVVGQDEYPLHVFGDHNLQNIAGAMEVCRELGISDQVFAEAMSSFMGASKRLQLMGDGEDRSVYLDFAHAPSKLAATVNAMKEHYPDRKLVACMELHTYSSLSEDFLKQYKGGMDAADQAMVYFNPHALSIKRLPEITTEQVKEAFGLEGLLVYNDSSEMLSELMDRDWKASNLLLMSSGNFDGWDIPDIAAKITS
ncbi:MAG: peptidoglycan synthetase [Bacteroidetes bacterium]|nr:MAG: peptidoglycan synthetase [Bacteroidota bacterium]